MSSPSRKPARPPSPMANRGSAQRMSLAEKLASTEALYKPAEGSAPKKAGSPLAQLKILREQNRAKTGAGPGMRPQALTCYLCGQQYFSSSLMIHVPQCQKKWVETESLKPRREQRPLPNPPAEFASGQLPVDSASIDEFNQRMYEFWDRVSLVGCPTCGRTFRPDALEKHAKACTADNPSNAVGPKKPTPASRPGTSSGASAPKGGPSTGSIAASKGSSSGGGGNYSARPLAYVCYLCGAQYGSSSLHIHTAQCQKKWQQRELEKPRREQRPLPRPPPELDRPLPTDVEGIADFNARMFEHYNEISLTRCPGCQRTFNPDAYERHAKSCPGAAGGSGGREAKMDSKPRGYNCYLCGQQFGSASLTIHIPQCHELWLKKDAAKPPQERRPPPAMPEELNDPLPTAPEEIDAFNSRMFEVYNGASLVRCSVCSRTFAPEALARHQKSCTPDNPFKGGIKPSTTEKGPLARGTSTPTTAAPSNSSQSSAASAASARPARPLPAAGRRSQDDITAPETAPPASSAYRSSNSTSAAVPAEDAYAAEDTDLAQCETCGRRFNHASLQRHQAVCAKVFATKRKAFNMASQRVAGTDAAQYVESQPKAGRGKTVQKPVAATASRPIAAKASSAPSWKSQSEALRKAMQAQRNLAGAVARGEDIRNIPYVPSGPDPSFVQCPTCKRHFNPTAAERHIPKCADIIAKPKALKGGSGGAGSGRSAVVAGRSSAAKPIARR